MSTQSAPHQRRWIFSAAALAVGLLLRVVFVILHPRWGGDTLVYGNLAENMLTHHVYGFADPTLRSTLIRLPGYPVFMAVCFVLFGHANYLAVVCVQVVVDLISCVMLSKLAGRLWGGSAALITLWLSAACPFTANYAGAALTETLSIFCVVCSFYTFERLATGWNARGPIIGWSLLLGVALSYAALVRPDQGLLAAAAVPALLWLTLRTPGRSLPQRLAPATLASFVVILPLVLWGVRNWQVFGVVQPLAPRQANDPGEAVPYGFQRWYRTWGIDYKSTFDIYWNYDGGTLNLKDLPARAFDTREQRSATVELFTSYNKEQTGTPEFDAAFGRIAEERIAAHPVRYYLLLPIAREVNMWLRPRAELLRVPIDWWNFRAHPFASIFEAGFGLLNLAYLTLALCGLMLWRRARWNNHAPLAIAALGFVILRCALLLTLDNSEPRYTLECFPVVILLAGLSLSSRGFSSRPKRAEWRDLHHSDRHGTNA
jgi:4-amino-4-deoxy-L-arabinose transferase-like glycosyltransferase